MKYISAICFVLCLCFSSSVFAQEDKTETPTIPAKEEAAPGTVSNTPPKVARQRAVASRDTIKGPAGKDISIVNATGGCSGTLKPIGIKNNSTTKSVVAMVEVTTSFSGHVSKKNTKVDNISPGETRFIGCTGCIDNPSGQTCSSYKVLVAVYK